MNGEKMMFKLNKSEALKNNKMKRIATLLSAVLIFATLFGCTEKSTEKSSSRFQISNSETLSKMPENLNDCTVMLGDKLIKFPLSYSDFLKSGFSLSSEEKHATLENGQYALFSITNGKLRTQAYFANFENETKKAEECAVCGLSVSEEDGATLTFPQGITVGTTDKSTVERAYGTPTEKSNDTGTINYKYTLSDTASARFYFKGGRLTNAEILDVRNPLYATASDKTPDSVKKYKKPSSLSNKLNDMTFYLYGNIYTFPVPVSRLIKDGWVLAAKNQDYVAPNSTLEDAVKLTKANRTLTFDIENTADYAATAENCFITSIKSTYNTRLDLTLYDGCRVGSTRSVLISAYGKKSFTSIEKSGKKTIYTYDNTNDKTKLIVNVNNSDDYITKIEFCKQ